MEDDKFPCLTYVYRSCLVWPAMSLTSLYWEKKYALVVRKIKRIRGNFTSFCHNLKGSSRMSSVSGGFFLVCIRILKMGPHKRTTDCCQYMCNSWLSHLFVSEGHLVCVFVSYTGCPRSSVYWQLHMAVKWIYIITIV